MTRRFYYRTCKTSALNDWPQVTCARTAACQVNRPWYVTGEPWHLTVFCASNQSCWLPFKKLVLFIKLTMAFDSVLCFQSVLSAVIQETRFIDKNWHRSIHLVDRQTFGEGYSSFSWYHLWSFTLGQARDWETLAACIMWTALEVTYTVWPSQRFCISKGCGMGSVN